MLWKLWRSTREPRGNSIFFFWSWLMTGCLTRFFPFPFVLYSLFVRSRIVSHLHKIRPRYWNETKVHGGRNGKYPFVWRKRILVDGGSRDSIRHANVSWPLHRQREGNTFRGRNAKVGSSMRLVASLQYFRLNDPLLAFYRRGEWTEGKDDSRILLWGGENRSVISFNLYVSLDNCCQLWEIKG